jgi:hypothetical protein
MKLVISAPTSVSRACGEIQEVLRTRWLPVTVECWDEQQTETDALKLSGSENNVCVSFCGRRD